MWLRWRGLMAALSTIPTLWIPARIVEVVVANTPIRRRVYSYVEQVADLTPPPKERTPRFARIVGAEYS